MFDPEKAKTAASLQDTCRGWVIFWSPARREFTAIAAFVPDEPVLINEPFAHGLLRRIGDIELAVSVGAPITNLINVGARRRPAVRHAPGLAAEAYRAVRPPKPRGRHAPGGGHAPNQGADTRGWETSVIAPPGVPTAVVTGGPAGVSRRAGAVERAVRAFIPRGRPAATARTGHRSRRSATA